MKLRTLLDVRGNIPTVVIITPGSVHDVNILDELLFEPGAIAIYALVATVKKRLNLDRSLYTILQILSIALFEKTPILQALSTNHGETFEEDIPNQLLLTHKQLVFLYSLNIVSCLFLC